MNALQLVTGAAFVAHFSTCAKCLTVDLERPATLANACLRGAQLFKEAAADQRKLIERSQRVAA